MSELDDAIEEFLRKADAAYEEYEQGYADADATLRRLEIRGTDRAPAIRPERRQRPAG